MKALRSGLNYIPSRCTQRSLCLLPQALPERPLQLMRKVLFSHLSPTSSAVSFPTHPVVCAQRLMRTRSQKQKQQLLQPHCLCGLSPLDLAQYPPWSGSKGSGLKESAGELGGGCQRESAVVDCVIIPSNSHSF